MRRITKMVFVVVVTALILSANAVRADEVTDLINEAVEAYNEDAFMEAKSLLSDAVQLVNQKVAEKLEEFLPKSLAGWKAMKSEPQQMPGVLGGGGTVGISKQYRTKGKRLTIEIMASGGGMMRMFMSPNMHIADGAKPIRVKRNKGSLKIRENGDSEMIISVVENKYLVKLTGSGLSKEELMEYANAIDFKGLKGL